MEPLTKHIKLIMVSFKNKNWFVNVPKDCKRVACS